MTFGMTETGAMERTVTESVPTHSTTTTLELPRLSDFPADTPLKWTWACRSLSPSADYRILPDRQLPPRPGDCVLVQIDTLGYHQRIMTGNDRQRLYEGDCLVGVFGNRYATDAYEGEVDGLDDLHILTGAGMIGTVRSKYQRMKQPTRLTYLGYLTTENGARINLKSSQRPPSDVDRSLDNVVLLVGTSMNSGKTTTAAKLSKALLRGGLRVAACKVTGSVSHRDLHELQATGVHDVRDFSDYGLPSTYQCDEQELLGVFESMLSDAARANPDVVVMEIADGVLQRETQMLLTSDVVRPRVRGVVLAAGCAPSALFGAAQVKTYGHEVAAISGCITNSPLFMREFSQQCDLPIGSSVDRGEHLAQLVMERCRLSC